MSFDNIDAMMGALSPEERIKNVADELALVHGTVVLRREKNGLHAYLACPKCLGEVGRREFQSKHLAVNLEKYLGFGVYATAQTFRRGGKKVAGRSDKKGHAQCMKKHGVFSVDELLRWAPLSERNIDGIVPLVLDQNKERYLVNDGMGNMIPDHPGVVRPVISLGHTHPAMVYLRHRDYDPYLLNEHFRISFCEQEAPEGEQYGRFYRKHPHAWKSTPQGRIIFYSDVGGIQLAWQGRYLDWEVTPTLRLVWHPYRRQWEPRPNWTKGEEPIKYQTAPSAYRNESLCGWDSVLAASRGRSEIPTCELGEGPLDAGRFPGYGLALLGKSISPMQIMLLKQRFRRVILGFDFDGPGKEACEKAEAVLREAGFETRRFFDYENWTPDSEKIDTGSLGYTFCRDRLTNLLRDWNQ